MINKRFSEAEDKERYDILGVNKEDSMGGIVKFYNIPVGKMMKLLDKGYADPHDRQNESPSIEQFVLFMAEHPNFLAHGYIVSNNRDDRRITIEGLQTNQYAEEDECLFKDWIADIVEGESDCTFYPDECGNYKNGFWSWWD